MSDFLRILCSLIIIIPLIIAVIYLLKRHSHSMANDSSPIQIIKQLSLSHKEKILVIEVDEVRLIIGISPHAFNTLHVLTKNDC